MSKPNIEALKQTVRVLQEVKATESNLDMGSWMCGSARCAVGWAASDQWFQDRGFTLIGGEPDYEAETYYLNGWSAVREFYNLTGSDADYLFLSSSYFTAPGEQVTVDDVIQRIEEFIEEHSDEAEN